MDEITSVNHAAQRLINEAIDIAELEIQDAVTFFKKIKDFHDLLGGIIADLELTILKLRQETMPAIFKEAGVSSIAVEGYRFTISHTLRASINKDKKEEAFQWLRDNDMGEIIIETVNASTLAAQARQLDDQGKELDQDLFKSWIQPNVSITKV